MLDDEFNWNDSMGDSLNSLSPNKDYTIYGFRVDAGAFVPVGNLRKTLGVSPSLGLHFGFPLTLKYRIDVGLNFFIPVNSNKLEYVLSDQTLSGKATWGGAMGVWGNRSDELKKSWVIDNRFGAGLGFLMTNIPKPKSQQSQPQPGQPNTDTRYGSETIFLNLGTGVRKGRIGLSLNYYFVPYINFKSDFGNQYLTVSTYFTF